MQDQRQHCNLAQQLLATNPNHLQLILLSTIQSNLAELLSTWNIKVNSRQNKIRNDLLLSCDQFV